MRVSPHHAGRRAQDVEEAESQLLTEMEPLSDPEHGLQAVAPRPRPRVLRTAVAAMLPLVGVVAVGKYLLAGPAPAAVPFVGGRSAVTAKFEETADEPVKFDLVPVDDEAASIESDATTSASPSEGASAETESDAATSAPPSEDASAKTESDAATSVPPSEDAVAETQNELATSVPPSEDASAETESDATTVVPSSEDASEEHAVVKVVVKVGEDSSVSVEEAKEKGDDANASGNHSDDARSLIPTPTVVKEPETEAKVSSDDAAKADVAAKTDADDATQTDDVADAADDAAKTDADSSVSADQDSKGKLPQTEVSTTDAPPAKSVADDAELVADDAAKTDVDSSVSAEQDSKGKLPQTEVSTTDAPPAKGVADDAELVADDAAKADAAAKTDADDAAKTDDVADAADAAAKTDADSSVSAKQDSKGELPPIEVSTTDVPPAKSVADDEGLLVASAKGNLSKPKASESSAIASQDAQKVPEKAAVAADSVQNGGDVAPISLGVAPAAANVSVVSLPNPLLVNNKPWPAPVGCKTGTLACGGLCLPSSEGSVCCVGPRGDANICNAGSECCDGVCMVNGTGCSKNCGPGLISCGGTCLAGTDDGLCCEGPSGNGIMCDSSSTCCNGACVKTGHGCSEPCAEGLLSCGGVCLPADKGGKCCVGPSGDGIVCNAGSECCDGVCVAGDVCPEDQECSPGMVRCGPVCIVGNSSGVCCLGPSGTGIMCDATAECCDGICAPAGHACAETCAPGMIRCGDNCMHASNTSKCCEGKVGAIVCEASAECCDGVCLAQGHGCAETCAQGMVKCGGKCLPGNTSDSICCEGPTGDGILCSGSDQCCSGACVAKGTGCSKPCGEGMVRCGGNCLPGNTSDKCCEGPTGHGMLCTAGDECCSGVCMSKGTGCAEECKIGTVKCGGECLPSEVFNTCCVGPTGKGIMCGEGAGCSKGVCVAKGDGYTEVCGEGRIACGGACLPGNSSTTQCCQGAETGTLCPKSSSCCGSLCHAPGTPCSLLV